MNAVMLLAALALPNQGTANQILARYQAWDEAYFAHDVNRLAGLLHPKFAVVTGSGKVISRREYVAQLWKSDLPETYATTILRVKISGSQATAWTREKLKRADTPAHEHLYRDIWQLAGGHWMLLQSKTVGER